MSSLRSKIIWMAAVLFVAVMAAPLLSPATARRAQAQTVPTITPTRDEDASPPPSPTSPAAPTEQATTPSQQATATRPPAGQATATRATTTGTTAGTATPTALLSGTAAAYPTAEACSLEPTALVLDGGAWLYAGPGEDYDRLGRLDEETVRPILARAAYGAWWLIALDDDETGWIADADVAVQGDTGEIAIEGAPPLPDGHTPTPGPTWAPTPDAGCVTPTATTTATATVEPTATTAPTATPTATVTPLPAPTEQAEPLPVEEEDNSLMWLPVAGIVLLAAGALLYVTRRS